MAIKRFLAPLNGNNYVNYIEKPYVDDIFDPLFNAEVKNYYNSIYGNDFIGNLAGVASGYGQMWENALTGKKGILGPGMGILGTFGRSMDKADDFILGGLTEGINLVGRGLGGSNPVPTNPLENIFVKDEDYEGTKLLAAMGNAMSRLSGNPGVVLDEQDFSSIGDKVAGIGIDLATDPGIGGSILARLNKGTPVGKVGQLLSDYDDVMGNIAGNMALPGAKYTTGKVLNGIMEQLSNNSAVDFQDATINKAVSPKDIDQANAVLNEYKNMAEELSRRSKLDVYETPEEYAILEKIRKIKAPENPEFYKKKLELNNEAQDLLKQTSQASNIGLVSVRLKELENSLPNGFDTLSFQKYFKDIKYKDFNNVDEMRNALAHMTTRIKILNEKHALEKTMEGQSYLKFASDNKMDILTKTSKDFTLNVKTPNINKLEDLSFTNPKKIPKNMIKYKKGLSKLSPQVQTKIISTPKLVQNTNADKVYNEVMEDFKKRWNIPDATPNEVYKLAREIGNSKDKQLSELVVSAKDTHLNYQNHSSYGTYELKDVQSQIETGKKLKQVHDNKQVRHFLTIHDARTSNIIRGNEMLTWLVEDGKGFVEVPLKAQNSKFNKALQDTITANVNTINRAAGKPLLLVVDNTVNGTRHLGYAFNPKELTIVNDLIKIKDTPLQDMIFKEGNSSFIMPKEYKDLEEYFDGISQTSSNLSRKLGHIQDSDLGYIKHVGADTPEAVKFWEDYGLNTGFSKQELDDLQQIVDEFNRNEFIKPGVFGSTNYRRYTLGDISDYENNYSDDLDLITTSTFTKGMFDNNENQTFIGMFLSDNFKIKDNFDSAETLKRCFYSPEGVKYNGNMQNLAIMSPKYDDKGVLTGFRHYKTTSDLDLEKAFADPNAILVPDNTVMLLDRLCKRNYKASNKVISFINKYFTTPFKLATLANPGFIVGNIEDAYFKQAVTMSKKYGTSFADEATNVAMSMREVIALNNAFNDGAMASFREFLQTNEAKAQDIYRRWTSPNFVAVPEQFKKNPDFLNAFKHYLNNEFPDGAEREIARTYLFLNANQDIGLSKHSKITGTPSVNNLRDLEDVGRAMSNNKYSNKSKLNRLLYGNVDAQGNMSKFTDQGIVNNWYSKAILNTSNDIETLMRSATVLNELKHKGYDIEGLQKALNLDPKLEKELYTKFKIDVNDAINVMNSANFNYDKMTGILNKSSYILPFPTFYLKNIGYWMDVAVNNPQIIDNVLSVQDGLWSGKSTEDEFSAEAKGRGAFPIGGKNKHLTGIVKQSPYNSMFGAFNAVNNPIEDLAFRTNPVFRLGTRHLQDKEDVKYRPYSTNQYEKNIKYGDKQFSNLAYMFHQLNPYERFTNTYLRTPGKVAKNDWQLSDFLPSMFQPDFKK